MRPVAGGISSEVVSELTPAASTLLGERKSDRTMALFKLASALPSSRLNDALPPHRDPCKQMLKPNGVGKSSVISVAKQLVARPLVRTALRYPKVRCRPEATPLCPAGVSVSSHIAGGLPDRCETSGRQGSSRLAPLCQRGGRFRAVRQRLAAPITRSPAAQAPADTKNARDKPHGGYREPQRR
jgi:hypothetical protein